MTDLEEGLGQCDLLSQLRKHLYDANYEPHDERRGGEQIVKLGVPNDLESIREKVAQVPPDGSRNGMLISAGIPLVTPECGDSP
jgi:hypothetical protein